MTESKKNQQGYLVLIGGAEDRKYDKTVLKNLVEINNAQNIVVIPTATLYPFECGEDYYYAFRDLGLKKIDIMDIREKNQGDKEEYLEMINEADLVFFTGGDQVRLTSILMDTKIMKAIKGRFLNEGLTVAGTSAGASAAADPMTFDGDNKGLIKGSIKFDRGFGFIKDITIDTHFVARGRLGRMAQFLCNSYSSKGIGIGENTSITILPNLTFYVTGTGIVTVVSTENLNFTNFEQIEEGERITMDGIQLGFLQHGAKFNLKTWRTLSCNKQPVKSTNKVA